MPHIIQLSLIKCNEGYKLVHVRSRCRIVWICEEYTCYLYGSFLFSGFNRFMHFMSTYANSWIKIAARQNIIWIRFGNRRAVRRRRTEAGMALTAIGEITQWGGVAGCSGSRTCVHKFESFSTLYWTERRYMSARVLTRLPFLCMRIFCSVHVVFLFFKHMEILKLLVPSSFFDDRLYGQRFPASFTSEIRHLCKCFVCRVWHNARRRTNTLSSLLFVIVLSKHSLHSTSKYICTVYSDLFPCPISSFLSFCVTIVILGKGIWVTPMRSRVSLRPLLFIFNGSTQHRYG